jgi:hypothetical protein
MAKITKCLFGTIFAVIFALSLLPPIASASFSGGDEVTVGNTINVSDRGEPLNYLTLKGTERKFKYTFFNFDNNGTVEEHPVYCIDPPKKGAYEVIRDDGSSGDTPNTALWYIEGVLENYVFYNTINAGYPHNNYTSWGLQNEYEGYYATKMALWMFIEGVGAEQIGVNPGCADQAAAQRVYEAALEIYGDVEEMNTSGASGVQNPEVKILPPSSTDDFKLSGENYEATVTVTVNGWVGDDPSHRGDIELSWVSSPPTGTKIYFNGSDITGTMKIPTADGAGVEIIDGVRHMKIKISVPIASVEALTVFLLR